MTDNDTALNLWTIIRREYGDEIAQHIAVAALEKTPDARDMTLVRWARRTASRLRQKARTRHWHGRHGHETMIEVPLNNKLIDHDDTPLANVEARETARQRMEEE